ncbi:MAG TPA: hypothetical protein VKM94_01530 [Blastocatellia bacterium]|nr:hypothetical protein [Blastocatellia bacterium]
MRDEEKKGRMGEAGTRGRGGAATWGRGDAATWRAEMRGYGDVAGGDAGMR